MNKKLLITVYFLTAFLLGIAQIKVGLWEPDYSGKSKQSVFFTGDSLKPYQDKKNGEHGTAVGFVLLDGLAANKFQLFHAGFVPLSQQLKETGIMDLTVENRKNNLPSEYDYYSRFAIYTVAWFKKQQVKVVNMSFGTSATIFAENNQNLGITDVARLTAARIWMLHFKDSFESAFRSAPEILFVVAAGNDEEDMEQSIDVPALVSLPNVLCVGALSKDGKRTISNFGKRVDVYLPAEDVVWKDAAGKLHTGTGTSLAVPQITRKAIGQLIRNPKLSAKELKAFLSR